MKHQLRLGINIDHVATLRNARGGTSPDPVRAAQLAIEAGADGITAHLREDRRHIRDADIEAIKATIKAPLNFEMAATAEMQDIALRILPNACCLVPEKREERTTEGGLDVAGQEKVLLPYIATLKQAGIRVSLFIEANEIQIEASHKIGADIIELHAGTYCHAIEQGDSKLAAQELTRLQNAARKAAALGLEVHAGHGITYASVAPIASITEIVELNIGHFLIGEAVFVGLVDSVQHMRRLMDEARTPPAVMSA